MYSKQIYPHEWWDFLWEISCSSAGKNGRTRHSSHPRSQVIGSPTPRLAWGKPFFPPPSPQKKTWFWWGDDFPRWACNSGLYIYIVYRRCFLFSSLWPSMILTWVFYPTLLKVTFDVLMWFVSTLLLLTGIISLVNFFRPCTRSCFEICLCGRDSQKQTQRQAQTQAHTILYGRRTGWCFQRLFMFTPTWRNHPIWRIYFWDGWFNHQLDNMECSLALFLGGFQKNVSFRCRKKKRRNSSWRVEMIGPARRILGLLAADLKGWGKAEKCLWAFMIFFSWCDVVLLYCWCFRNHSPVR